MVGDETLVELTRGGRLESAHRGHAVVVDASGQIIESWGDPELLMYPRSSCKMIQALPLAESGVSLTTEQFALSCASHRGAAIHTERVNRWLDELGMSDDDFRCGPQMPNDRDARYAIIRSGEQPCQVHNNCSGKHAGFLTMTKHIGAGPEYVEPDHPLQRAIRTAFEEVTKEVTPGYGIDGCSAPNFACTLTGLARAMATFAAAGTGSSARDKAMVTLREAMMTHPELISGEDGACTALMRAAAGKAAIKDGAEGVYTAILPEKGIGIALKITDGAGRAAECAIAAILARHGVIPDTHPLISQTLTNRRDIDVGTLRAVI
ncbi:asparaginase [Pelagovum pacificum]|uniref:Asparaginase n=1 Tax=Pelagovum pacificum TaxID=2588711 RepID=A0A5C5GHC1_9RHOB|nr:asparaginase [Pelagovum pacificum]QQA42671.1 asparaginase [Pelagovum pacificum]TNY34178.1 asparaginase [Pelagovum pacificum]